MILKIVYNEFLRRAQKNYNAWSFSSHYSQLDPTPRRSVDNDYDSLYGYMDAAV